MNVGRGQMFVISGPSGAGKSTVLARVLGAVRDLHFSVSHTTRQPRAGETQGVDYHFVTHDEFQRLIAEDALLEWAEVHGQFYGTPDAQVRAELASGKDVILDLDVQGARKVRERRDAVFIFLAPPSLDELSRRLRGRRTESEDRVRDRLETASEELGAIREYKYLVVNENVGEAALQLQSIIEAERARVGRAILRWPQLDVSAKRGDETSHQP